MSLFQSQRADDEKPMKKYAVRPPKDLTSRFERKQEAKRLQQLAADDAKKKKEEEEQQMVIKKCHYISFCLTSSIAFSLLLLT